MELQRQRQQQREEFEKKSRKLIKEIKKDDIEMRFEIFKQEEYDMPELVRR